MKVERKFLNNAERVSYYETQLDKKDRKVDGETCYYLAEEIVKSKKNFFYFPQSVKAWTTRENIVAALDGMRVNYDYTAINWISEALFKEFNISTYSVGSAPTAFRVTTSKVKRWGAERDLLKPENSSKQFMKFIEEAGELSAALLKKNKPAIIDGFGDVLVTLAILAEQNGYDLERCYEAAYKEIENREGETVDGSFIRKK